MPARHGQPCSPGSGWWQSCKVPIRTHAGVGAGEARLGCTCRSCLQSCVIALEFIMYAAECSLKCLYPPRCTTRRPLLGFEQTSVAFHVPKKPPAELQAKVISTHYTRQPVPLKKHAVASMLFTQFDSSTWRLQRQDCGAGRHCRGGVCRRRQGLRSGSNSSLQITDTL